MPIKQGDRVKIVNPVVVLRVGYPLCIRDGMVHVEKTLSSKIDEFHCSERARKRIVNALAHDWLKLQRFGGTDRSVHTKTVESLRGEIAFVNHVKTRITGQYNHGFTDYEGDHTPAYLSNQKSHRIATLDLLYEEDELIRTLIEIETCNLELV